MKQVKVEQSRISKVIEGIRMLFRELSVNEEAINNRKLEQEVEAIRAVEDTKKIESLEENISKVNISLKDSVVAKAKVSEKRAKKVAEEVKESKMQEKDSTKQIEEK